MDVQETAAVGSFVWIAGNFRGRNVGVQQRGEITERFRDASGVVPTRSDCDGAERGDIQRESDAGGEIGAGGLRTLNNAACFRRGREPTQA
jgi:hypothetical protein